MHFIKPLVLTALLASTAATHLFAAVSGTTTASLPAIADISTNLGVQIRRSMIMRSDVSRDPAGRDVLYTVILGAPATLAAVDVATGDLITSKSLPDTSGAWGVKASPDGTIYIGAYNLGLVYRYFPATGELKNLGHPFPGKDTVLYPMDAMPDGKIYGGSYPSGHAYEFDPAVGKFRDLGDMTTTTEKERWLRVTVCDPVNKKLYFGIGNQPQLVEYDLVSGAKRDILPPKHRDITSVYDMNLVDGRLFCRKETHNAYEYFVLDVATGNEVTITNSDTGETSTTFTNISRGLSPPSPDGKKLYFVGLDRNLGEYDLLTNTVKSLKANVENAATSYAYVKLSDASWPGYTLIGTAGNKPRMYRYNLQTGKADVIEIQLPAEAVNIHEIRRGPDGKIYTGGYLAGNMGVYDPASGSTTHLDGSGQTEGMVFIGNKLFMGVYPDAKILEYDITKPWSPGTGDRNPRPLFDLTYNSAIPNYTNQDRPFAMAGSEDLNKLFIGTVPKNGMLGGVLAIYDVGTTRPPDVHWNLVPDQSIVSLAYKDGFLYGGSSIYGGMGVEPRAKEAELFIWDVAARKKVASFVPVKGKSNIPALHAGPDGNIWGIAGGALFIVDPVTRKVVWSEDKYPNAPGRYRDGSMITHKDGNIYGTLAGTVFRINPQTRAFTALARGAEKLDADAGGLLYVFGTPRAQLFQIDPASLPR